VTTNGKRTKNLWCVFYNSCSFIQESDKASSIKFLEMYHEEAFKLNNLEVNVGWDEKWSKSRLTSWREIFVFVSTSSYFVADLHFMCASFLCWIDWCISFIQSSCFWDGINFLGIFLISCGGIDWYAVSLELSFYRTIIHFEKRERNDRRGGWGLQMELTLHFIHFILKLNDWT
jgi:hypothetical protein